MISEIRRVPSHWQHPRIIDLYPHRTDPEGLEYQPLYDANYRDASLIWIANFHLWEQGKFSGHETDTGQRPKHSDGSDYFFWEYRGAPDEEYHRSGKYEFQPEEATCFQVYEDISEGTPVSPVFQTALQIINFFVEHGQDPSQAASFVNRYLPKP